MNGAGIAHRDLHDRNILVPNNEPDQFVIIDLEMARDDIAYCFDLQNALISLLCCDSHLDVLLKWCAEKRYGVGEWYMYWPVHGLRPFERCLGYESE